MTKKVENYTQYDVLNIIAAFEAVSSYDEQKQVAESVAEQLSKTVRQILGKVQYLSRNGTTKRDGEPLYIKRVYEPKAGGRVVRKSELVDEIAVLLKVDSESIASLESATKTTLELLKKALTK